MPAKLIDGKKIAKGITENVKDEINHIVEKGLRPPCLAVIIVGEDPASQIYVRNKKKKCKEVGIKSLEYCLAGNAPESELIELIEKLNKDDSVDGILVQMPLPEQMDSQKAIFAIDPKKDVDGFHPYNVGLISIGEGKLLPCTPAGVVELVKQSDIDISGKHCVVAGRSNIVGKPAAMLMLKENATVSICHSKTKNFSEITNQADILVAAIGKAGFIKADMIKEGAVVIDVGINRLDDGKVVGDVLEACAEKASFMTPVPGGVGPMTIAMLMKNCLTAYKSIQGN